MTKQDIVQKVRNTIEHDPYRDDVRSVSIFGSYARGTENSGSDVDILIEFEPTSSVGYFALAQIQRNLEKNIGKEIDLLTPDSVSDYLKEDIFKSAQKVYEKG